MSQYTTLESYAAHIRQETSRQSAGLYRQLGPKYSKTVAITVLCTEAANIINQSQMRREQAGEYDLAALMVQADAPGNSETPFEDE